MLINNKIKEKYISFDVFGTLLYRDISEDNIFKEVEKKIQLNDINFENFYQKRIKSQKEMQSSSRIEATIDEIYEKMNFQTIDIKDIVLNLEIETEIEHLHPNLLLITQLNELKKIGKKIIIISDMYLTNKYLSKILERFSISYDYLYISSDIQLRKSSSKLFKYVLKDLNIDSKDMVHIGDNFKSDYLMPKIQRISSVKYNINKKNKHIDCLLKLNSKNSMELNKIFNNFLAKNYYEEIGYKMFGPLLFGFCQWIHQKIKTENLDYLCFLSRDGQIVKKAYEIMYKTNEKYFLASRRTLTVPLLTNANNMKDILDMVPYIKREENVKDFLSKIGIYDERIKANIEKKYGSTLKRCDLDSYIGEKIFEIIKSSIYENSYKEKNAAIGYISENLPNGRIGLVDIGWYGTMQKSLDKICKEINREKDFYGLYFGLLKKGNTVLEKADGYIYDYKKVSHFDPSLIYGFNGLIELMFTADHGSAKRYVKEDKRFKCELEKDKGEYNDFVQNVQAAALKFIQYMVDSDISIELTDKEAFCILEDLLSNPTLEESCILGDLYFYDAYFEKIVQFKGWINLFLHPKDSISCFLKSNWKIGFIRQMHFLNPYRKYKFIEKLKKGV